MDIPVSWLRTCETPAELQERITEEAAAGAGPPEPGHATAEAGPPVTAAADGGAGDRYAPFPLTDLQQAYLVAKDPQLGDDTIGCHVYREFEVAGLDVAALQDAWHRVVRHHDMLRAVITPDGRQRVQEPESVEQAPLAVGGIAAAPEVRTRLSHRRYAPGDWPMHTVEVSHDPGGRSLVHLSIDVLLTDGHGLGVILDDWWRCYRDPAHEPAAPALTVRDCVLDLAAQQRTPAHRAHLDHWTERLAGLPDGPPVTGDPVRGPVVRTALDGRVGRAQWQAIGRLAADWEVSPTALVLTVFAEAFSRQRHAGPLSLVLTTNHRSRLPAEAEDLVGPFTSSLVLPLPNTLDDPLREAARDVHRRLWEGLDHAAVSGVSALRALRAEDRTAPVPSARRVHEPARNRPARRDGFAGDVTFAMSQTSGVALDHQMWERDGELRIRWDVVTGRFAPGEADDLFAGFLNSLHALSDRPAGHRAMNELQQAYFVPRAITPPGEWDGCQVYHSFDVDDLDPQRLATAWQRLIAAYDVLRTVVTHDGRLAVSPHVPDHVAVPVQDLTGADDRRGTSGRPAAAHGRPGVPAGQGPALGPEGHPPVRPRHRPPHDRPDRARRRQHPLPRTRALPSLRRARRRDRHTRPPYRVRGRAEGTPRHPPATGAARPLAPAGRGAAPRTRRGARRP